MRWRTLDPRRESEAEEKLRGALLVVIPRLSRLALRLCGDPRDAEDLVGEALLRAVSKDPSLERLDRRFAWLAAILVNLWRDSLRRKARRRETRAGDDLPERECPGPGPAALAQAADEMERVRRALAELPPKERAAIVLAVDEGMAVGEIARALGSSPDRVKANLWLARRRLREKLGDILREGIT